MVPLPLPYLLGYLLLSLCFVSTTALDQACLEARVIEKVPYGQSLNTATAGVASNVSCTYGPSEALGYWLEVRVPQREEKSCFIMSTFGNIDTFLVVYDGATACDEEQRFCKAFNDDIGRSSQSKVIWDTSYLRKGTSFRVFVGGYEEGVIGTSITVSCSIHSASLSIASTFLISMKF